MDPTQAPAIPPMGPLPQVLAGLGPMQQVLPGLPPTSALAGLPPGQPAGPMAPPPGPPMMPPPPPGPPPGPMGPPGPPPPGGPPGPDQPPPRPRLIPPWMIDQIARRNLERQNSVAGKMADYFGPPPGHIPYSIDQQVEMWVAVPPDLKNPDALAKRVEALRATGSNETEIRDKIYPLRRILMKLAGTRPKEQAGYAGQMDKLSDARLKGLPDPEEPFAPSDHPSEYDDTDGYFDYSLLRESD